MPTRVGSGDSWFQLSAGNAHTCAIRGRTGTLLCWGDNTTGQLGQGTVSATAGVSVVAHPESIGWSASFSGNAHTCSLDDEGSLYCFGDNDAGQLGDGASGLLLTAIEPEASTEPDTTLPKFALVMAGAEHTCAVATENEGASLYCFGNNASGQLGVGSSAVQSYNPQGPVLAPAQIATAWNTRAGAASGGNNHTCAIDATGALRCFGNNANGQLGLSSTTASFNSPQLVETPATPANLADWRMVSTGGNHTCAIVSITTDSADGPLFCWGANDRGQLGLGDITLRTSPVQVGTDTWISIAAGAEHTCAVRRNGTLWCFGDNSSGQSGLGTDNTSTIPANLPEEGWLSVAAGRRYSCAIRTGGELWCWGKQGSLPRKTKPELLGAEGWRMVRIGGTPGGGSFACGLRGEAIDTAGTGTLWCWGNGSNGQLGNGNSAELPGPKQIAGDTRFRSITTGDRHMCAVRDDDGQVYCTGSNALGQAGRGLRLAPVQVREP